MDFYTAAFLAPLALAILLAVVSVVVMDGRTLILAILILTAWAIWQAQVPHWCIWEGFADGLLPVECRAR